MLSDTMVLLSALAVIVLLVGFIAWDSRHPATCFDLAMHYQVFPELWFYLHEMECQQAKRAEAEARNADHAEYAGNAENETSPVGTLYPFAELHRELAANSSHVDHERD
jgi:hypothetical protein